MVVGLHAGFLADFTSLGQYLTVNGLFRIAVPVFFIINGFYFYPILKNGKETAWLKKTAILYIAWMAFYSYFWFYIPDLSLSGIAKFTAHLIIGYHHLWYIAGMLGAGLLIIIMQRFSTIFLIISTVFLFLIGVSIQYIGNYHYLENSIFDEIFNFHWSHRNTILFSYPFFCTGYLINKLSIHEKISSQTAMLLGALGIFLLLIESYANYYQHGRDGGFDNYLSLLFVCPFIFLTFIKSHISGKSKEIALYSSAIYFIHSFFLSVFRKFTDIESTQLTILTIIISAIASYFIIKINAKVKFIL